MLFFWCSCQGIVLNQNHAQVSQFLVTALVDIYYITLYKMSSLCQTKSGLVLNKLQHLS